MLAALPTAGGFAPWPSHRRPWKRELNFSELIKTKKNRPLRFAPPFWDVTSRRPAPRYPRITLTSVTLPKKTIANTKKIPTRSPGPPTGAHIPPWKTNGLPLILQRQAFQDHLPKRGKLATRGTHRTSARRTQSSAPSPQSLPPVGPGAPTAPPQPVEELKLGVGSGSLRCRSGVGSGSLVVLRLASAFDSAIR